MPARRVSMRQTREILRLLRGHHHSARAVASALGLSPTTVTKVDRRATEAGLGWPLPADIDDAELEERLFGKPPTAASRPLPDFEAIDRELRKRAVTLMLLWLEYRAEEPGGYSYSRFCELYGAWKGKLAVSMRQHHRAGDKLFVDFSGLTVEIADMETGEVRAAEIFVATLGASDYIWAEACEGQDSRSWITAHIRTFEHLGGVAAATVPDNLKSGVTKPDRYQPDINRAYLDLAEHYEFAVLPTRVRKPKDKAKVENAVQQVQRWALAPLRHEVFTSVAELNRAMRPLLVRLNERPLTGMTASRAELLRQVDKPALRPLPARRFEVAEWKQNVGVNIDYHIEFERSLYSVPYQLVGERVDVRATHSAVAVYRRGRLVTTHARATRPRSHPSTKAEHMPAAHRRYAEWTPSRILQWARTIGPRTEAVAGEVMRRRRHPEQGFRSCMGIMNLAKTYGAERVEAACARAIAIGSINYPSIASILKTEMDKRPLPKTVQLELPVDHANLRGPGYYH